jgi:hypothetical protein
MPIPEQQRLDEAKLGTFAWKKWGPYLSERQWGTVREDYSENGDAWGYFSHDQARSRAYHWGEDGIAGISDDKQILCFALALWNGKDPILKERMFGLTNAEGNHGEDVKEYYFYVDSAPTHSYMKYLYKYPQAAYPYDELVRVNGSRSRDEMEYELIDTGIFDDDRYFDVFVEYAKETPDDVLIQITAHNRGADAADLHLMPTLWFRNTWTWTSNAPKPSLEAISGGDGYAAAEAKHAFLGRHYLYCEAVHDTAPALLFTENETNYERVFGVTNISPYVKDGINNAIVHGQSSAVNPEQVGTKMAAHYSLNVPAGGSVTVRLRLCPHSPQDLPSAYTDQHPFTSFDQTVKTRLAETDEFYDVITPDNLTADQHNVMRQALASMLWTKQYYAYEVEPWLRGIGATPFGDVRRRDGRNRSWFHMVNEDILSMPDKWEYPWYAAWDLAFHTLALQIVDIDFAKDQLLMMLREDYMHPNGQMPAYEWNFSDVNPPVHAWSVCYLYMQEKQLRGEGDTEFLKNAFHKLQINFTWWVNRKDRTGSNVFEGGFLGLDNIGVFDRSAPLPTGGYLEQADGTAWMAFYALQMLQMAILLAPESKIYEEFAVRFFEHFLLIAGAMDRMGDNHDELWDEEDGFFYDLLRLPDGSATRLKVRSMVGLLPLAASLVLPPGIFTNMPLLRETVQWFREFRPEIIANLSDLGTPNSKGKRVLAVTNEQNLQRILTRMLDETEFFSQFGIRALSRVHLDNPYEFTTNGQTYTVNYEPAESSTGLFGGNSNWRGPIWMPVNLLMVRSLYNLYAYYEDDFTIECPTGSGNQMTLWEVLRELMTRLTNIFLLDENNQRPVYGGAKKFQDDPHWRDYILFYEYFHGDNGAGLGASHQTGWTGIVAILLQLLGSTASDEGKKRAVSGILLYREDQEIAQPDGSA